MNAFEDNIVGQKNVLELFTVANELCLFLEKVEDYNAEEIIEYLHKICPLLYLKGCLLPDSHVQNPSANERFVTEEQWEYVFNAIRLKLGENDEFLYIDEDRFIDDEIERGSLAEHFADIYQDLKDFTLLYQKNNIDARENAVHSCRELFAMNWGLKLARIIKAVHYRLFAGSISGEENEPDSL